MELSEIKQKIDEYFDTHTEQEVYDALVRAGMNPADFVEIEGWMTRSGIGKLAIWNGKPTKKKFYPATCGKPDYGWSGTYPDCQILMWEFGDENFPSLTFDNSPRKVRITITSIE